MSRAPYFMEVNNNLFLNLLFVVFFSIYILCHKLWYRRPLIFQTMNSIDQIKQIWSIKFTLSGYKDIEIRQFEFEGKVKK